MNNEKLLDYLYGEMSDTEKSDFEKKLALDAHLKNDLEEMQLVRKYLKQSRDQTPQPVKLVVEQPPVRYRFSRWWAVAASLLLLMMAGKLLDLRISLSDQQLVLSYGAAPQPENLPYEMLARQYTDLTKSLDDLKEQFVAFDGSQLSHIENIRAVDKSSFDAETLTRSFTATLENQQAGLENRVASKILEEQQIFMQAVAQDLMRYWDEQRKNDLNIINEGMRNLAQSIQLSQQDLAQFVNNTHQNY